MQPPPPSPTASASAVQYEAALLAAGWGLLAGGAGGRVYHRPADAEVIKVADGDECYHAFVCFALANSAACLPRLSLIHWDPTGRWGVVHVERLASLTPPHFSAVALWWRDYQVSQRTGGARPTPSSWSTMMDALIAWLPPGTGCGLDVQAGNAMLRGSDVVFTDLLF